MDCTGESINISREVVFATDHESGAEVKYVQVTVDRGVSFAKALERYVTAMTEGREANFLK